MASIGRGRGILLSKMISLSNNNQEKLMTPGQFSSPSNEGEVFETDNNLDTELEKKKEVTIPSVEEPNKISQEDIDWQVYKFTRKVKETLKNVDEDNFSKVLRSLKELYQDYPISSRFSGDNCSEVKHILDVLIQKSVTDKEFIQFSPKVIKMLHDHAEIEFLQYFPTLIQDKRKEVINVCASQESLLPESAKNFCQLLGKLFVLPRQLDNKIFDLISAIVEEFVERWTIIDESESASNFSGHNLSMAQVKATAAHVLIKEISMRMYDCDREVTKKMENFVWSLRETVLNNQLPRALKEIYLDALIDIQCATKPGFVVNSSNAEIEDEIEIEIENDNDVKEDNNFERHENGVEKDISEKKEDPKEMKDNYMVVKYFLRKNDLDDLLADFIENELTDQKMSSFGENGMVELQKAGISKLLSRNIMKMIESRDWDSWTKEASAKTPIRETTRNSISSRMAIAFPSSVSQSPNNKAPISPSYTKTNIASPSTEVTQIIRNASLNDDVMSTSETKPDNVLISDSTDSDPDVEIEEDEENSEENDTSNSSFNPINDIPKRLPGSGRGRGMVKFHDNKIIGGKPKGRVPVAKIQPTDHNLDKESRFHSKDERRTNSNYNKPNCRLNHQYRNNKPRTYQSNQQPGGRFQPVYHPKNEPRKEERFEKRIEFGTIKPKMCFNCSSIDHTTEECTVINPFF